MKQIPLTQNKVALVDDEDYEYINRFKWQVLKKKYTYYAIRSIIVNGKKSVILMHREIIRAQKNQQTDHEDGNGLNNQKSNLRACTHAQNMANRRSWGKSKYLGVYYSVGCICAGISINGKWTYLGIFRTEEDAARAYDNAARNTHGEFARLNF